MPLSYVEKLNIKAYERMRARARFVPRCPELLAIEGDYGDFRISCRHRDILRCSDTPHFISCFRPAGAYNHQPLEYCKVDYIAILFKANRAGHFKCRAFVMYVPPSNYSHYEYDGDSVRFVKRTKPAELVIQKFYGDGLNEDNVLSTLKSKTGYEVRSTGGDFHV